MKQRNAPTRRDRQAVQAADRKKKKVYASPKIVSHEVLEVVAAICAKATMGDGVCGISNPLSS
jgi:hypothetical protein